VIIQRFPSPIRHGKSGPVYQAFEASIANGLQRPYCFFDKDQTQMEPITDQIVTFRGLAG
jgi:hypothetical protein